MLVITVLGSDFGLLNPLCSDIILQLHLCLHTKLDLQKAVDISWYPKRRNVAWMCGCSGSNIPRRQEWPAASGRLCHTRPQSHSRQNWAKCFTCGSRTKTKADSKPMCLLAIPKPQLRSKEGDACQIERALFSWKLDGFGHACLVLKRKKKGQYPNFRHCKMKGVNRNKRKRETGKQENS